MISKDQVKHIAGLARLGLTDEEIEKYQKDISSVLDYVEKLEKVNVSGIEPTSHSVRVENATRKDEIKSFDGRLMDLAPDKKENYLKVKSILK